MTDAQLNLYVAAHNSQTAAFNAQIAGMVAENKQREVEGNSPAYVSTHFIEALGDYKFDLQRLAAAYGIEVPN